ncbi:segregation and condensation protein A [Arthrobacter castelli]|uniref:segregation and condensation protein A n=1 Tax=Arthrobacter castelli TaxID=271431 RepID=UPI000415234C|nr:ScpA family protein [Arthrobacter castelli]
MTVTGPDIEESTSSGFEVTLDNFTGPFDLLLGLISKHEMDITEIALARVTDEFISYIRKLQESGQESALDEASEFLVVAATLLDLKTARLLPAGEVEDEEDIALLEARDLLFARLLQYKAFKQIAAIIDDRLTAESARYPRQVSLEPQFAALLPELIWKATPDDFAALAAKALEPKEPVPTEVGLAHLHAPEVSVREQAGVLGERLKNATALSFRVLTEDAENTLTVVARFLALLEMFRDSVISFDQVAPLGELTVRWAASDGSWNNEGISGEFDDGPVPDTAEDE